MITKRTNGLIIKETKVGEGNKIFTVLTEDFGKIQISARGVRSYKSKLAAGCTLFGYSSFVLNQKKEIWTVTSADIIYPFYDIRSDFTKLSYATYFCALINTVSYPEEPSSDCLRLILNTLFYVEKFDNFKLAKACFELRLMKEIGMMPNLNSCVDCGNIQNLSFFNENTGELYCNVCKKQKNINENILKAMRYIINCDVKRLFYFSLEKDDIQKLSLITEKYLKNHIEFNEKYLNYIKKFVD